MLGYIYMNKRLLLALAALGVLILIAALIFPTLSR